jgi:hypothetical protein
MVRIMRRCVDGAVIKSTDLISTQHGKKEPSTFPKFHITQAHRSAKVPIIRAIGDESFGDES